MVLIFKEILANQIATLQTDNMPWLDGVYSRNLRSSSCSKRLAHENECVHHIVWRKEKSMISLVDTEKALGDVLQQFWIERVNRLDAEAHPPTWQRLCVKIRSSQQLLKGGWWVPTPTRFGPCCPGTPSQWGKARMGLKHIYHKGRSKTGFVCKRPAWEWRKSERTR